jgi:serine protease autotransporter
MDKETLVKNGWVTDVAVACDKNIDGDLLKPYITHADVLELVEDTATTSTMSMRRGVAPVVDETPEVVDETPEVVDETPEVVDETPEVVDETPEVVDETPEVVDETPEVVDETDPVEPEA